ncbi:MAG: hypothetical protein ACE14M_05940 [Terriglobales bacterium]
MDVLYVFTCGIAWRNYGDSNARRELIKALESGDPDAALVAEVMLEQEGEPDQGTRASVPPAASDVKVSIEDILGPLLAPTATLPDVA